MFKTGLLWAGPRLCSPLSRTLRSALLGTVALGLATPALAQGGNDAMIQQLLHEVRELRQKQEELEREIERQRAARQVVSKDGVAVVPENVVVGGERPRTFVLPGTDTEVRIGGYVKGDLIYDIDSDVGDTFDVGAIPPKFDVTEDGDLVPNPEALREGRFGGHARESRLNIATWTPSPFGEIHTFLEGDFFGAGGNEVISNSRGLRLRHAYGEIGPLLVGQTWTTFMHPPVWPIRSTSRARRACRSSARGWCAGRRR